MSGDGWDELLAELDDDQADDENEWGEKRVLEIGTTVAGYWRGQDEWQGDFGPTPVYLMTDGQGTEVFFFGGRAQLDRKLAAAAPSVGDRVAIRRLEDAPAAEGRSPAWRVRVAVRPGDGTVPTDQAEAATGEKSDGIPF